MRSMTRHLSPLFRSRRRLPFFFTISILLITALILFLTNNHFQTLNHRPTVVKPIPLDIQQTNEVKIVKTTQIASKRTNWPLDEQGRSLKTKFLVLDLTGFFGSGATEGAHVFCPSSNSSFIWTRNAGRLDDVDFIISHDAGGNLPFDRLKINEEKQQYSMAFIMESEVHSSTGDGWSRFNFKMTYNLDDSYPEPATYFDVNSYITDLLRPVSIPFEAKETGADLVWIISNCNAHNGREGFIQRLMQEIKIDSYGSCLNNRQGYAARMSDNVAAYKKYKFVIAIENSNCHDYVTEKLVKAVESGAIPIVAGRNGRPDYRRYLPDHSYINIFDYPSIKALANHLKEIASNKTLYESYLWYKKHTKDMPSLMELPLEEKVKHFAEVVGSNATLIRDGIVGKEKSENKVCKLIRFVRQTPWKTIAEHRGTPRVSGNEACLPNKYILNYFDAPSANNTEEKKV